MKVGNPTRVSCWSIVTATVILLMVLDIRAFGLVAITGSLNRVWGAYEKTLLAAIAIILFLFMDAAAKREITGSRFLDKYVLCAVLSTVSLYIFTYFKYPQQNLTQTVLAGTHFLIVPLALPLYGLLRKQGGSERIFVWMNKVTFVWYCILIFQSIIYLKSGRLFLHIDENIRNDSIRISLNSIGNLMIVYNFNALYSGRAKKKGWYVIQLALGAYCLIMVQQTRAYNVIIGICIAVIIMLHTNTPLKTLRSLILIAACFVVLDQMNIIDTMQQSFSVDNEVYGNGTKARMLATTYYWEAFLKSPLFGQGFINSKVYLTILRGNQGIFNYSDVGFLGLLANTGLLCIAFYIWPLLRWGKQVIGYLADRSKRIDNSFLIAFFIYIAGTSTTLIMTDPQRILLLPFSLAVFEYARNKPVLRKEVA